MKKRIHLFGASGSGTTSIAARAAEVLGYNHFDSDNYFWMPTEVPFTEERPNDECIAMMKQDLEQSSRWFLSGSLSGWGEVLLSYFDLAVFVCVPQEIRLERLRKREFKRYGVAVLPGGERYEATKNFLGWCAAYEDGTRNGRSLAKHEALLKRFECPVLRIVNLNFEESVDAVVQAVQKR